MPPGTRPYRWAFPARNRIIAGLARITVVVEAAERSGSLITSDFASELGREVAAVPGSVLNPRARGTNALLRDGAILVRDAQDVLDALFDAGCERPAAPADPAARLEPRLRELLDAVQAGADTVAALHERTGADLGDPRRPGGARAARVPAPRPGRALRAGAGVILVPSAPMTDRVRVCLSIAGSDSGGGAGIQADLKAFAAAGVHGTTAITAITAQNTVGVTAVHPIPPDIILAQVRAVAEDLGVDAVKVGMLGSVATTEAVAQALDELPGGTPVVVDPVMVAESGARLLEPDAQDALRTLIVPRATVLTPNLPEARVLADRPRTATCPPRTSPAASTRSAPRPSSSPAGTATRRPTCSSTGRPSPRSPGSATPTARPTARAAPTPRRWRRTWRSGRPWPSAARAARAAAGAAVRDGLRGLGAGPGPVDVLRIGAPGPRRDTRPLS